MSLFGITDEQFIATLSAAESVTMAARKLGVRRDGVSLYSRQHGSEAVRQAYAACVERGKRHGGPRDIKERVLRVVSTINDARLVDVLTRAATMREASGELGVSAHVLARLYWETENEAVRGAYRACVARGKHLVRRGVLQRAGTR